MILVVQYEQEVIYKLYFFLSLIKIKFMSFLGNNKIKMILVGLKEIIHIM